MRPASGHLRFVTVAIIYAGSPDLVGGRSQETPQVRFED